MRGYINVVYKNGNVYVCDDIVVKTIFKEGNCYYVMNNGSLGHPYYVVRNIDTKKEFTIGDQFKLCDFCAKCDENITFVCDRITRNMGLILFASVEQKRKELGEIKGDAKNICNVKNSVSIDTPGYQMREFYNAGDLVVGKLACLIDGELELESMFTEQKYLFEKILVDSKIKYREIFSGFMIDPQLIDFDIPYIVDPEMFTDYFPLSGENSVSKVDLIWFLNDINYPKKKSFFSRLRKK